MRVEPLVVSMVGIVILATLFRIARSAGVRWMLLVVGLVMAASGYEYDRRLRGAAARTSALSQALPTRVQSRGYVSSDQCLSCHPEQHASWHRSYHRTMTQAATPAATEATFDQVTLELRGRRYELRRRGDALFVEMDDPRVGRPGGTSPAGASPARIERRITLITGSHNMQAFWYEEGRGNRQESFPFTWMIAEKRWVPRNDSFVLPPDHPVLHQVWNENCLRCHVAAGIPGRDSRGGFATETPEYGIACESCHGPGEAHVRARQKPWNRYFAGRRTGRDPTIFNPAHADHQASSEMCGSCHAVAWIPDMAAWSRKGFTYQPGGALEKDRFLIRYPGIKTDTRFPAEMRQEADALTGVFWRDGTVRVSGRDFTGMRESPCYQRGPLSCLSCHTMHGDDPVDQLERGMGGNEACLQCHSSYRKPDQLAAHTHHGPASAGSDCYNCHMPHTTFGLLKAIRSHRISNPTLAESVDLGRPNACNLCHLDRTLAWAGGYLERWYGRQPATRSLTPAEREVPAGILWATTGDAAIRVLAGWHFGWKPSMTASGTDWQPRFLELLMEDDYSAVRYVSGKSLRSFPGFSDTIFDYVGTPEARERTLASLRPRTRAGAGAGPARVAIPEARIEALLRDRDRSPVELVE